MQPATITLRLRQRTQGRAPFLLPQADSDCTTLGTAWLSVAEKLPCAVKLAGNLPSRMLG